MRVALESGILQDIKGVQISTSWQSSRRCLGGKRSVCAMGKSGKLVDLLNDF